MATPKKGSISQRVPLETEKRLQRLANKDKIPLSVRLQIMIDAEYKRVFNTKS